MPLNLTDCQFAALLHDVGKFYQRTTVKSDLSADELKVCPDHKGHYSHLHAGYTARFFKEVLKMDNELSWISSIHHKDDDNKIANIIKVADRLASSVDRSDETVDTGKDSERNAFIKARLSTIFQEVSFTNTNKKTEKVGKYYLCKADELDYPNENMKEMTVETASSEYRNLFDEFVTEVKELKWTISDNMSFELLNKMYALLYKYTTTIPASTYESEVTYVSLFDHSKLTSAIAGCLFLSDGNEKFYMYEFDISGIQNFIYKIVEGAGQKKRVAKALRGRSAFINILTDSISYAVLNLFGLQSANIIFDNGGGATILLPYLDDTIEKVKRLEKEITKKLYDNFLTDITFVSAFVELNGSELKGFKAEKALELKTKLDLVKSRKYEMFVNEQDFYHQSGKGKKICEMCGNMIDDDEDCVNCEMFEYISSFYTCNDKFLIKYDFSKLKKLGDQTIDMGYCYIDLIDDVEKSSNDYFSSANCCKIGEVKFIANSVPKFNEQILNFEEITQKLIPDNCGDKKMGILKMDIDDLSAIFAFGLKNRSSQSQQRAMSKYLTLSRLLQMFFGEKLVEICKDLSFSINDDIEEFTDNGTMFYINYAGGDDLVIIGPAYGIIRLADTVEYEFNNYTLNKENIKFSAGIHIQNDKEPIRFGIQEADKMLKLSKLQKEKNSISIIGIPLKYGQFCDLLNDVDELKEMIDSAKVSRTLVYNLLLMLRDKNFEQYKYSVPIIYYYLYRNIEDEQLRKKEFLSKINSIGCDTDLNRYVLMLKLTIMFTRA